MDSDGARRADEAVARDVNARHGRALLGNPTVNYVDVGWRLRGGSFVDEICVRAHVARKLRGDAFERFARARPNLVIHPMFAGAPVDVVEAPYAFEPSIALATDPADLVNRTATVSPLMGGISLASEQLWGFGTLGSIVLDVATGEPMALSNWHVLVGTANPPALLGADQPAYVDAWWHNRVGVLARHGLDQNVDAAVVRLDGTRPWRNHQVGLGTVTGPGEPSLGLTVAKSGRRSGVTHGVVDGIDGALRFTYAGVARVIENVCHIAPSDDPTVSLPGDSGSAWIDPATGRAVALHFAGSTSPVNYGLGIAMPVVLATLGVTLPPPEAS